MSKIKYLLHEMPQAVHIAQAEALRPKQGLTEAELKEWDKTAPRLAMLGRLRPHFTDALMEYCRVIRRLADTRAILDREGWTYGSETRYGDQQKSRPEVAQLNADWVKWWNLQQAFGFMPSPDKRLSKSLSGNDALDDFDSF